MQQTIGGWRFAVLWTILTAIGTSAGWALAFLIFWGIAQVAGIRDNNQALFVFVLIYGLVGAAAIGLAQQLLLRRAVPDTRRWTIATCLSGAIGSLLGWLDLSIIRRDPGSLAWALFGIAGGFIVGTAQSLVLGERISRKAGWILATAAGGGLGMLLASLIPYFESGLLDTAVAGVIAGIGGGSVTGTALARLLQSPRHST